MGAGTLVTVVVTILPTAKAGGIPQGAYGVAVTTWAQHYGRHPHCFPAFGVQRQRGVTRRAAIEHARCPTINPEQSEEI
jgi:hypothetical protein